MAKGMGPLGLFTLWSLQLQLLYLYFLLEDRFKAKVMCLLSESLAHLGEPYSRRKHASATQCPAEESVMEVSREDRNIWGCKAIRWQGLGAGNVLESGCKTQGSGTEEHKVIVSLSWGMLIFHYTFSLCQGGLGSQNSKRSSEEKGLKYFISEIFMNNKKKAAQGFSTLKWRKGGCVCV